MNGPTNGVDGHRLIDLNFRPGSYFWPISPERHALTRIKGTARRRLTQKQLDGTGMTELPDAVTRPSLSHVDRQAFGQLHPSMMGGEYLPDLAGTEIEIARIEIRSTTYDVSSMLARAGKRRIRYRAADEYEGETLADVRTRTSMKPLTLGELTLFFMGAWDLMEVLQANFDDDLAGMLRFFRGSSPFYPDFDQLLRQNVIDRFS